MSWSPHDLAILERRTRALGRALAAPHAAARLVRALVVDVAGQPHALITDGLRAVAPLAHLSPVPHAPSRVAGLAVRAGRVLPVFFLAEILGLPLAALPEQPRIVVLGQTEDECGLVVNVAREDVIFDEADLEPVPADVSASGRRFLRGILRGVPVIDTHALLISDVLVVDARPAT